MATERKGEEGGEGREALKQRKDWEEEEEWLLCNRNGGKKGEDAVKETLQSQQRGRKCGGETHTGSVASFMVGLCRIYNIRTGQGVSRSDPTHYHSGRLIWAVITCDFQTSQTEHVHTQLPKRACAVNDTRVSQAAAHFFFYFCLLACMEKKTFSVCVCVSQRASDSQRSKSPKNKVAATSTHHYCTI